MPTKKRITLRQFVKEYYDKEHPRRVLYGNDYTEKSAKILKAKLGRDYSVGRSPSAKGRYIVFKVLKREPFEEYYRKYKDELNIVYKQKYGTTKR